jgi:hypothetical protein
MAIAFGKAVTCIADALLPCLDHIYKLMIAYRTPTPTLHLNLDVSRVRILALLAVTRHILVHNYDFVGRR